MMDFIKRLFGGDSRGEGGPSRKAPDKPPLPEEIEAEFKAWWLAQRTPAVALTPATGRVASATGSRLGGPAWLAEGEAWPSDTEGVPLEFLAQLDLTDCRSLEDLPRDGLLQFFIGRDDLFGADFDDLLTGKYVVRHVVPDARGSLHEPPPLGTVGGIRFSDFSPFQTNAARETGLALAAEPFEDWLDQSVMEAEQRIYDLYQHYDIAELEAWLEQPEQERPIRHHAGGFPAFTQSDFRYKAAYADYDRVLLRLTSDDSIMWGDAGEAVFMIRSTDLANGDFGRVAFSWDCH